MFKLRKNRGHYAKLCRTKQKTDRKIKKISSRNHTHPAQKRTTGHQTKYTSLQERSIQRNKTQKTDNHSSPQRHWLITIQSNS